MVVKYCPDCRETLAVACKTCPSCGYVFQLKKVITTKHSEKKSAVAEGRLRPERNKKIINHEDEFVYHGVMRTKNSCTENESESEILTENSTCSEENRIETETENFAVLQQNKAISENDNTSKSTTEFQNDRNQPIKKRGRPKGSKDKQKRLPKGYKQLKLVRNLDTNADAEWEIKESSNNSQSNSANEAHDKDSAFSRKRGRPRGSRNKPSLAPLFYAEDDDDDEIDSDDRDERFFQTESAFYIPPDKEEKFSLILEGINHCIAGQKFKT